MAIKRTGFCELTGIDLPIVQAPIGGPSVPALAGAVSEAGGLGMLAVSWSDRTDLAARIDQTRALTDRPFGVNLILQWAQDERVRQCLDAGVKIISTFWGDPSPLTDGIHAAGALHLHSVGSVAEARRAADAGVDVIVAQGWEAGGHVRGTVTTLALVPAVVDAVSPVPVLAAGGIADGRGLAAVLALGADAGWIGTRFLLAEEAATAPEYRELVANAAETDTAHGIVFDKGWPHAPHRALRNSTVRAWEAAGCPAPGSRPGEDEVVAAWADGTDIPRYADVAPLPGITGQIEAMALYAGQSAGLVREVRPAADIVADLVAGAQRALASTRF